MNPKIPKMYMLDEIERERRQDEAMEARGWIKIQSGMWVSPSSKGPDMTKDRTIK